MEVARDASLSFAAGGIAAGATRAVVGPASFAGSTGPRSAGGSGAPVAHTFGRSPALVARHIVHSASAFPHPGPDNDDVQRDLDLRTPDSVAARLTVNPTADTSAQVSWARLDSPEALEPDVSVQRLTASVMWNRPTADHTGNLSLLGLVGRNAPSMGPSTNAGLGEAALMLRSDHTLFSRVELLSKSGHDQTCSRSTCQRSATARATSRSSQSCFSPMGRSRCARRADGPRLVHHAVSWGNPWEL